MLPWFREWNKANPTDIYGPAIIIGAVGIRSTEKDVENAVAIDVADSHRAVTRQIVLPRRTEDGDRTARLMLRIARRLQHARVAGRTQAAVDDEQPVVVSPCGMCREMISDFAPTARVIVPGEPPCVPSVLRT